MTNTSARLVSPLPETLVLWDVDHTLIENGGVSKETYALAFELLVGHAPAVRPATDGRTDFQIMRELLAANHVDTEKYVEISQFERALDEAMGQKAPQLPQRGYILPGVIEALTTLAGVPTVIQSVLTGNIARNAWAKLSAFSLDRWVDLEVGGFGSDAKVRSNLVDAARRKVSQKYGTNFNRSSTILVGDTLLDIQAAHDGGAKITKPCTGWNASKKKSTRSRPGSEANSPRSSSQQTARQQKGGDDNGARPGLGSACHPTPGPQAATTPQPADAQAPCPADLADLPAVRELLVPSRQG